MSHLFVCFVTLIIHGVARSGVLKSAIFFAQYKYSVAATCMNVYYNLLSFRDARCSLSLGNLYGLAVSSLKG